MTDSIVYYNGEYLKESEVRIEPSCRGLHYGDGVFETMRSYSGRIFRLSRHVERLFQGLAVLRIDPGTEARAVGEAAVELLVRNTLKDAAVKIIAFRQGGEGPSPPPGLNASILITARPFDFKRKARCEAGLSARLVPIRRNHLSPVSGIKSLNYLDNIIARMQAREHRADEALFLNAGGLLAEGAVSNIFVVRGRVICTPPPEAGILCGITREAVIQAAAQCGISCVEKDVTPEELYDADEVFLTNSLMEIMPLLILNGRPVGSGRAGEITGRMKEAYADLLKDELEALQRMEMRA